jgi:ABC-type branched-subunit amino acid transport system substrate-binding protein
MSRSQLFRDFCIKPQNINQGGKFMKKTRRALALVLITVMMLVVISGCGQTNTPTQTAEKTASNAATPTEQAATPTEQSTNDGPVLKVGFLCDMTGVLSWYGGIMNTLGRSVVDMINEEGIKGFTKMEVKTYDIRSDQPTAIEQVTRAKTEDGMDIVWGSWVEAQLIPFANKFASIPYVMNNTTGLKPLNKDAKWVIMPSASSWDYGVATAGFFKEKGVKTWAITGQGWGEGWLDAWAEGAKYTLKDTDIKCVWDKEVPADKVDWSADINEWKKLQPDAIVIPNPGAGAFSVIKQMRDSGYWPKYVIFDPMAAGDYTVVKDALGKKYLEGLISVTAANLESDAWKDFAKKHIELGYFPYGFSAEMWDTLHLIKQAAEKVGPQDYKDPQKLMDALRGSSYAGALGNTLGPFRENGLQEKVTVTLVQCVDEVPDWTDKVDYSWKPIYKQEIQKQMSLEEAVAVWPDLGKRLGQ